MMGKKYVKLMRKIIGWKEMEWLYGIVESKSKGPLFKSMKSSNFSKLHGVP